MSISAKNNYIKYVISRGDYIFLFLNSNPIVFILQIFNDENIKFKVASIEKLNQIPSLNYLIVLFLLIL